MTLEEIKKRKMYRSIDKKKYSLKGQKCSHCSTTENLQRHHLYYEHYKSSKGPRIIILCKDCHEEIHNHRKKAV